MFESKAEKDLDVAAAMIVLGGNVILTIASSSRLSDRMHEVDKRT
jgi:hypothetical protein